jgi:hypothetical protein
MQHLATTERSEQQQTCHTTRRAGTRVGMAGLVTMPCSGSAAGDSCAASGVAQPLKAMLFPVKMLTYFSGLMSVSAAFSYVSP